MEIKDLDCLYEACPIPLIRAIQALRTMQTGDILVVHSDESCAAVMMQEWAQQNGYSIRVTESDVGEWEIYLQKP
ncbi:MAG: hypothetical protein PWQ08_712 [Clostridiales bacterium]|jgi:TusA-related sulfurtransferase|nr:sulfurtransferase TusA family protein [Pygmaiobacter sp.]MDK2813457.1 hypothetical protein [Clostridiales bacterium]